ncbi:hypothetical protein Golomagni_00669 [Golovinomyces magnicellulatus]|nr:hypothetical protein Golomagni_00669 [Golovinomyces magnicellulatus]
MTQSFKFFPNKMEEPTDKDAARTVTVTDGVSIKEDVENLSASNVPVNDDSVVRSAFIPRIGRLVSEYVLFFWFFLDQSRELMVLFSSDMGFEVVQILVGPEKKLFTIHRDLLLATGDAFVKAFDPKKNTKGRITMSSKSPDIFKLFVDMIYTRQVPAVTSFMTDVAKDLRVRNLCQLYVFTEELDLLPIIRNQIFDRIQDGFLLLDKLPEIPLISSIYRNTSAASQLRKFIAACLVHKVRSNLNFEMDTIAELFKSNEDIVKDFLAMVHYFVPGQDPRIRNCEGHPGCLECLDKVGNVAKAPGVWPCSFHIHIDRDGVELSDNEVNCHLWCKE